MPEQYSKPARTWTLASDSSERVLVYACEKCRRFGQYRRETLIAKFGGDTDRTAVLELLARGSGCTLAMHFLDGLPRPTEVCGIKYVPHWNRHPNLRADILAGRGVRPPKPGPSGF